MERGWWSISPFISDAQRRERRNKIGMAGIKWKKLVDCTMCNNEMIQIKNTLREKVIIFVDFRFWNYFLVASLGAVHKWCHARRGKGVNNFVTFCMKAFSKTGNLVWQRERGIRNFLDLSDVINTWPLITYFFKLIFIKSSMSCKCSHDEQVSLPNNN